VWFRETGGNLLVSVCVCVCVCCVCEYMCVCVCVCCVCCVCVCSGLRVYVGCRWQPKNVCVCVCVCVELDEVLLGGWNLSIFFQRWVKWSPHPTKKRRCRLFLSNNHPWLDKYHFVKKGVELILKTNPSSSFTLNFSLKRRIFTSFTENSEIQRNFKPHPPLRGG